MATIYVVSFVMNEQQDIRPTVTAFDNEDAAKKMYGIYKKQFQYVWMDTVQVYSGIIDD